MGANSEMRGRNKNRTRTQPAQSSQYMKEHRPEILPGFFLKYYQKEPITPGGFSQMTKYQFEESNKKYMN